MTHPDQRAPSAQSDPGDQDALRPVTPVSILASRLARLTTELAAVPGIAPSLLADARSVAALAGGLDPYLSRHTSAPSAALQELGARTVSADWVAAVAEGSGPHLEAEMLSGHVEGQTLRFFVKMLRAQRVLDIGMFTGYSALAMAEALPDDGVVVACEVDPAVAAFARRCFEASPAGARIEIAVGPAIETLATLAVLAEPFDLVFIDADKAGYGDYLDAVLDGGLLAPRGVICVDNTLLQGQPWMPDEITDNGAAIAAFNAKVTADVRLQHVLLPLRDGLTLIRRVGD